jgi:phosphopantothenoylcysteine decarboxylase
MAKILLGVTGSVAAIKVPELFAGLRGAGHVVKVAATKSACYFFDPVGLAPLGNPPRRNPEVVTLDEDEWPGERYRRGDPVVHIELRRWAEVLLIAPLDANTMGKLANGLADNCLTCVWRAWEPARPVVLAPAMNTLMWQHPATRRHLRQVALDLGISVDESLDLEALIHAINASGKPLRIVAPQEKRLACDDVGIGAMAELDYIISVVKTVLH